MGVSGLPLGFAVHVPNSPGDLFLCLGFDAGCLSNLLAGTSLEATRGVAVDVGGLWGWGSERNWQAPGTDRIFHFLDLGQPPGGGCHLVGVSWECRLLKIKHHRVWHSYLPMETGKPTSGSSKLRVGTGGWAVWDLSTFDSISFSYELG